MQKKARLLLISAIVFSTMLHGSLLFIGYQIILPENTVHQFSLNLSQAPKTLKTMVPLNKLKTLVEKRSEIPRQETVEAVPEQALLSPVVSEAKMIDIKQKYFNEISHQIHKHKYYPRRAYTLNQEGLVLVSLKLGKNGNILDLFLIEECPFDSLNHAALDTISGIQKFPAIPDELGLNELTLKIPVEYKIKM
jgi:TonB family protein